MATHHYETRGAGKRAPGALPDQGTHKATVAAKQAAAAWVSDELRHLAASAVPAGTDQSPKPSAIRDASRARARHTGTRLAPPSNSVAQGGEKTQDGAAVGGQVTVSAEDKANDVVRANTNLPATSTRSTGSVEVPVRPTQRKVVATLSRNEVTIEVVIGNIALEKAAAIVDPANGVLVAGGGVSKALAEVAGAEYRKDCTVYVRMHGHLRAAECCVTGGFLLSAPHVIHVVSVKADDFPNINELKDKMLQTYSNVLAVAVEWQFEEIAVPAIGAGLFGVPLDISAGAAAEAIILAADELETGTGALQIVRFVLPNEAHAMAFVNAFQQLGLDVDEERESSLSQWHDAATTNRVLQAYYQEARARAAKQDATMPRPVDTTTQRVGYVNPGSRHMMSSAVPSVHVALPADDAATVHTLERELAAARAQIAHLQATQLHGACTPVAASCTGAGTVSDSETNSQITSVSERTSQWAAESTRSLGTGAVTDVVTDVSRKGGEKQTIRTGRALQRCAVKVIPTVSPSSLAQESQIGPPRQLTELTRHRSSVSHHRDQSASRQHRRRAEHKFDFKPRPYGGDVYVEQYLTQFRCGAETAGWPKEEWGLRLITSLEGRARRVISENYLPSGEKPSFDQLAKLLRESFASDASPAVWLTVLEGRQRYAKESLTELSQAITETMAKAFPGLGIAERQRLAIGYFARAMDPALQQHTLAARPSSLAEALQTALAYENASRVGQLEANRRNTRKETRIRVLGVGEEEANPQCEDAMIAACAFQVTKQPPFGGRRPEGESEWQRDRKGVVCQICDRKGHAAKDCWHRNNTVARPTAQRDGLRSVPQADQEISDRIQELENQIFQMKTQAIKTTANKPPVSASAGTQESIGFPTSHHPGSCFICGEMDHWARECPKKQPNRGRGRGRGGGWGNGRGRGGDGRLPGRTGPTDL